MAESMGMLGREEGTAPKKGRDARGWGPEARFRSLGLKTGPASNQCTTQGQLLIFWDPLFLPLSSGDRDRVAILNRVVRKKRGQMRRMLGPDRQMPAVLMEEEGGQ